MSELQPTWARRGYSIKEGEDVISTANLDWSVRKCPVACISHEKTIRVPGMYVLLREPGEVILGPCIARNVPMQNDLIITFFQNFLRQSDLKITHAGTTFDSRIIYVLAKTKYGFSFDTGADRTDAHILLTASHAPARKLRAYVCLTRSGNMSTFTRSLYTSGGPQYTTDWTGCAVTYAQKAVAEAKAWTQAYEKRAFAMSQVPITEEIARFYFQEILKVHTSRATLKNQMTLSYMLDFFRRGHGTDLLLIKDSWWGAFQAAAYYFDNYNKSEGLLASCLWGTRSHAKRVAFGLAHEQTSQYKNIK